MGEAKRRKELGLPPRQIQIDFPKFDKNKVKNKVRKTLYKYPIIPFLFYALAIAIFIFGIFRVFNLYK